MATLIYRCPATRLKVQGWFADEVPPGPQGGPFSPASFSYTLSVASGSVNYSITNVPNWLTPSSTSGTASSSGTTVTFTVNANANSLTPNNYVSSINFNNTTNGQGNTTRVATLTVNPPPLLQVTPATNMVASGMQGGPFSPSSFPYTLSTSSGSINFAIFGFPSWLTPSATSGTASTNGTIVTFTVNASANSLAANTYIATITFTNSDTGQGTQNRTATLTVNPPSSALQVTPTANIVVAGNQGALAPSLRKEMATKDDINRLDTKLTKFEEREIDKRLQLEVRVSAIEKHLGLDKKIAP
jgi:hypothetical protein